MKKTNREKQSKPTARLPVISVTTRAIGPKKASHLYVRAGGRCEFFGCNKYLFQHHLTHDAGNFSEKAHIVAYSDDGPRGKATGRPANIHVLDNLMLLCPFCHKLIDDHPDEYPVEKLRQFKYEHEDRIFRLTEIKPDQKTKVVKLLSQIAGERPTISNADVKEAIFPRYPQDPQGVLIDLSDIPDDGKDDGTSFYRIALPIITQKIAPLYEKGVDTEAVEHVSVFAFATIPLLVFLGNQLNNKIPVELYQRHKDTENWAWKQGEEVVIYKFHQLRVGKDHAKVALILSLSGAIKLETLPHEIDGEFSVYEITLDNLFPTPNFLRLRRHLDEFKKIYQQALRFISSEHLKPKELHLFPAVPPPVAVLCGRELMPKIDPALLVYDDDRKQGGFKLKVKVNER